MKASQSISPLRPWLVRLVVLSLASLSMLAAGCSQDKNAPGSDQWKGQGDLPLPEAGQPGTDCTIPETGCLCDIEGQHLACGKVVADLGTQVSCGQGVSVCTKGRWSECILTGMPPVPVDKAPPGFYYAQGASSPTQCDNNPCNPYCYHFPDNYSDPSLADSGTNLISDGGLSTTWDASPACVPLTKAQACAGGKDCGEVADGCGGLVVCGPDACVTPGWICGGGGVPNKCGTTPIPNCTPLTKTQACTNQGLDCDWVPDGCGGVISCGNCTGKTYCGLGGANKCGEGCKNKSCNQMSKNCGVFYDECGVLYDCGLCKAGDFCGTYTPNVCWNPGSCTPKTVAQACTQAGKNCGAVADGCGGTVNCGSCAAPLICGGAVPNVCGGAVCTPKTVAQACTNVGKDCGPVTDGCGGVVSCGGPCQEPATCGGGGVPNKCGVSANCTNLCLRQVTCAPNLNGGTTSITGTVYAPNGVHPLPGAVVYVPNAAVPAFPSGVTCENCAQAGGSPLVSTKTGVDGTFTIKNMPTGANIPLVIQIGRWRRQITIPNVPACANTALTATQTRLPRNKTEGDIPKIAVVTGCVDSMECVLRRMGIADSEFTNPSSNGRVHLYYGGYCYGAYIDGSTPREDSLVGSLGTLDNYDMVLFPCQSNEYRWTNGYEEVFQNNIADYVNEGGRAFMTHYNYHWLLRRNPYWDSPLYTAINWNPSQWAWDGLLTATINQSFTRGDDLAHWLMLPAIGASTTLGQIDVGYLRRDYSSWSAANTISWLTYGGNSYHVTFDTPLNVPQTSKCGRVVFSDFHVYNANGWSYPFPSECPSSAMTDQEKVLEYMIFDLSSCVSNIPPPATCVPMTCASQGITCGQAGDGCGNTLTCGAPCPVPACTPMTCAQQGANCDLIGDGCGGILNCGTCASNYLCTANVCQPVACVKDPCPTGPGGYCGPVPVGCGEDVDAAASNKCPCTVPGETCGGSGITHKCGGPCVKLTCGTGPGSYCGTKGDGCGGKLLCGCTLPETCGGSGDIDKCGVPVCNPKACVDQGISCGQAGDGCGNVLACGTCTAPQTCGGGGVPGKCGFLKTYNHGYFVRDYYADCGPSTVPFWELWSWSTVTAGDSYIDFKVQTADTEAGLATAPADQLQFSLPPGPASEIGLPAKAHAANQPIGSPDTQVGAASVDNTLELFARPRHQRYLRITVHLAPSTDLSQTSILSLWDMQVDCIPSE